MTTPVTELDDEVLRRHRLPDPSEADGKHDRGTVLVAGATVETPGALLLAGLAALRVGAGRLQIAAPEAIAPALAVRVPEAQVIGLACDRTGTISSCDRLAEAMAAADAVLVGSGLGDEDAGRALLHAAIDALADQEGRLVVDAASLVALGTDPGLLAPLADRAAAIPNLGEATALGADLDGDPADAVRSLADQLGCAVAIRGPETWIAAPGRSVVVERAGPVGLATSGSGDVLAGMVAGHLARGAEPFVAALWSVHLHAQAGRVLTEPGLAVGLLARELIDAIPKARARWSEAGMGSGSSG